MTQNERLARLKKLLELKKWITKKEVLEHLEVSESTFKRDLEYLRSRLHYPIEWDGARGVYYLDSKQEGLEIPGFWLTHSEINAFFVIDQLIRAIQPELLEVQSRSFKKRVSDLAQQSNPQSLEILRRVRVFRHSARQVDPLRFEKIAHALIERKCLKISYQSRSKGESTEREVSPQRLVYYRDNWYLDAFCHWREGIRSFSIDNIQKISTLQQTAIDLDEADLDRELASGYGIFSGSAVRLAVLRFTEERARWVASETWHSQQKTYRQDGFYYLEIPFSDDRELILDILRFGPEVEVVEPLDLRDKIKRRLKEAIELYKK